MVEGQSQSPALAVISLVVVFGLMSSFASGLDFPQFVSKLKQPKGILIGLLCQYIIIPFISFLLARLYALPTAQAVGLVITGTCPGGTISNLLCFLFGADITLSITMTSASSLSSFIFLPLNGYLYVHWISNEEGIHINYGSLGLSVAVLMSGLAVGLLVSYFNISVLKKVLGTIGFTSVITMVVISLVHNGTGSSPLVNLGYRAFLAPLTLAAFAVACSFLLASLGGLKMQSRFAVTIESSCQNCALSIAILYLTIHHQAERDLAVGMPMIYAMMSICLLFVVLSVCVCTGVLQRDPEDKSISMTSLKVSLRSSVCPMREKKESEHTEVVEISNFENVEDFRVEDY